MLRTRGIQALMSEAGIKTQTDLALILKMDRSRVNSIIHNRISGRLNLKTVDRFCTALGCEPGDILERVSDPPQTESAVLAA